MRKHKAVKVVPVVDFLVKIIDSADNNIRMSNKYSWKENYLDNACRKARGHSQLRLLDDCLNALHENHALPVSQHRISYYCGKSSTLDYNFSLLSIASILFEYVLLESGLQNETKLCVLNNPMIRSFYV